jgi:CrcB protein
MERLTATLLGQLLVVGAGGFLGSAARFGLSGLVQRYSGSTFPLGTLAVNLTGCLAIGLLAGLMEARQILGPGQRLFLLIGVLGGFTTFSTLAYETLALFQGADAVKALANMGAHVILGMAAAWAGYTVAQLP